MRTSRALGCAESRLPWLTALAAWNSGTTYTRGIHFVADPADSNVGEPDVGDATPLLRHYGLALTRAGQFAVEHRRGWRESTETPSREEGGHWDERRIVETIKQRQGGDEILHVTGTYAAFRTGEPHVDPPLYWTSRSDEIELLEGVQWADWDSRGRLLAAKADGRLVADSLVGEGPVEIVKLGELELRAAESPDWAGEW